METSKIKKGKGKTTYFFLFHLIFVKMKKFFTILALKQPNSLESILAVCKYSRRLLTRTLSPKVLSNDLSLWLSYDCLTHSQILIFLSLILNNFILVSKSNSSVFKIFVFEFDAPSWKCANEFAPVSDTKMCEWICASIRYKK